MGAIRGIWVPHEETRETLQFAKSVLQMLRQQEAVKITNLRRVDGDHERIDVLTSRWNYESHKFWDVPEKVHQVLHDLWTLEKSRDLEITFTFTV
jgi:hypothetical protein